MNMSSVVSSLIQQHGLYYINLPFKDPTEIVVHNILKTTTIPEYSQFVPWTREYTCPTNDLAVIDKKEGIYFLPHFICTTPIMYVSSVEVQKSPHYGAYGDLAYGVSRSVQGVITSQAYSMVVGKLRREPTFEYLGENQIRLHGYPPGNLTFRVACEHNANGETIPPGCRDSFMELAAWDLKVFLYNNLKGFDGIATAHGTINLKIEEYQGAESERKALLDTWRDTFHLDQVDLIEFI
jgi:hypothetical protein